MTTIKTYRDLIAWQKSMSLARQMYACTRGMPDSERFGLLVQMRRAAVSIPSNIAEGYARQSRTDYLRFLRIARGSLAELATQYELAYSMAMLEEDRDLLELMREVDRVLQGLIRSLERSG